MTAVRAIGTSTAVLNGEDGLKTYKTLKVRGDKQSSNAPLEIKFEGHRYFKQEVEKNGKKEIMYVCVDEDPTDLKEPEAAKYSTEKTCADGKDDGEISWEEKLWSMGKGIIKPFKDMFNFSSTKETWKSIGKIALAGTLIGLSVAFPAVGLVLAGVGAIMGAATLTTGIVQANKSKKDADTKAAYENIGNGTFTLLTSLLGFKAMKNSIATKATAIDKANIAATPAGSAAPAQINQIGGAANSATIKTGILPGAVDKVKNIASVVKPEIKPTLSTLKAVNTYNTKGLALAKISCDTGITADQLSTINNLSTVNAYVSEAQSALTAKDITTAFTAAQKLKTLLPFLSDADKASNEAKAALELANAISSIPKVTASIKGTTAVVAANGANTENMFIPRETQKLQAYSFVD